ncbi:hypothetical protein D3093_00900 [Azospirillum argentinense]|uniref:Uncharacterized protein n=1 Tax=Azospirillum argentinense TaxID=2970906 RepID=A0A4D8P5H7_9PROT|nr:hypothetical protein [Azospirillum argentinense]QCN93946.1 hypothetical protein D3093_00900 [Azospirillum argentinense]
MFDPAQIGRISPVEQADALRTLIAVFATAVVRPGEKAPRNAVSAEIVDILDEVPAERVEAVAQLFTMMALRLRRKGRPRRTAFRLTLETALLARSYVGEPAPQNETSYLSSDRPGLGTIDHACNEMLERMAGVPDEEQRAWLTAQVIATGLIDADRRHRLGGPDCDLGDMAVAEFLLRTAAQYLAATAVRTPPGESEG